MNQIELDKKNAAYWNEPCGLKQAKAMGISEICAENLKKFDVEFFRFYSYLLENINHHQIASKKVLEIGLGFGTLGQELASRGCEYYGVDIAEEPVNLMKYRISINNYGDPDKVQQGSVLHLPYEDNSFDCIYSIGCLHHTGDIQKAVKEIRRVLRPGGFTYVMLYNRHSFRQLIEIPIRKLYNRMQRKPIDEKKCVDSLYDRNIDGDVAPHIDYVTKKEVFALFHEFTSIKVQVYNFDDYFDMNGLIIFPRSIFLNNIARIVGLDLYIYSTK